MNFAVYLNPAELDALSHVNINAVPDMLIECLFLIATLLADIDVAASFGIYKSLFCTYRGKFKSPVLFLQLGFLSHRDRRLADYQELLLASLDCEQYDDFLMLNTYYLLCPERDETNVRGYYQSNWLTAISRLPDCNYKGMYCYNLANSYKADHFYYKAARYYSKARKLEPNYLTQSYWWRELGSCLFLTKHYSGAESCYRKSQELSEETDPLLFALIGDCEFWQCKFKHARQSFRRYAKDTEKPSEEFLLKVLVCNQLVENSLSDIPRDKAKARSLVDDAMFQDDGRTKYELLESAIRCDPLCHEAWYLMSVYHNNKGEPFEALFSAVICGTIREHDAGILLSALHLSLIEKELELAALIAITLKEKFSHDLKEIVENFVSRQTIPNGLRPEAVSGLMNLFNQIDKGNQSETMLEVSESLKNCIHISFE